MSVDIHVYTANDSDLSTSIEYMDIGSFQVLNREQGSFDTYYAIRNKDECSRYFSENDIDVDALSAFDCYVWDRSKLLELPDSELKNRIIQALDSDMSCYVIFQIM